MLSDNRILLIDPTWRNHKLHGPSLGLAYVAAAARGMGAEVSVCDFIAEGSERAMSLSEFQAYVEEFLANVERLSASFGIIGITCSYATFSRALAAATRCKKGNPEALVLLGGPHVSSLNHLSLSRKEELIPTDNAVDLYVVGEGEQTLREICQRKQRHGDLTNIRGTIVNRNGRLMRNKVRPMNKCLDRIGLPDWSAFDLSNYPGVLPLAASRGCPYRCAFCDERLIWQNTYRYREPATVVEELRHNLVHHGVSHFRFADSQLTCYPSLEAMCALIRQYQLDIKWSCYARANEINKRVLDKMRGAGCTSILIGVESGTQEILNTMNKRILLRDTEQAVRSAKEMGIAVEASLIIGFPGETEEQARESIEWAKSLRADSYDWHSFFPGLEMLTRPDNWQLILEELPNWNVDLDIPSHLYEELFKKYPEATLMERHASARIRDATVDKDIGYSHKSLSLATIYGLVRDAIAETHRAGLSTEESLEYRVLNDIE